jgi:hypothetical protein
MDATTSRIASATAYATQIREVCMRAMALNRQELYRSFLWRQ